MFVQQTSTTRPIIKRLFQLWIFCYHQTCISALTLPWTFVSRLCDGRSDVDSLRLAFPHGSKASGSKQKVTQPATHTPNNWYNFRKHLIHIWYKTIKQYLQIIIFNHYSLVYRKLVVHYNTVKSSTFDWFVGSNFQKFYMKTLSSILKEKKFAYY